MTRFSLWRNDIVFGVRLALRGGRTGLVRFVLGGVGIGLGVAVLLLASAIPTMIYNRDARQDAVQPVYGPTGAEPLLLATNPTQFHGRRLTVEWLHATGPTAPIPPGLDRVPGTGEMVASPALAQLLDSPAGELLRPRFPQHRIGIAGEAAVRAPGDLIAYVGEDLSRADSRVIEVYGFGHHLTREQLPDALVILIVVGSVALLTPVFVFIAASTRIAGAERDRRLSAIRLVGASDRQLRRIASAESLVSAVAGVLAGVGLFVLGRRYVDQVRWFGSGIYPDDVVPAPALAVFIVLAVPVMAVLTARFAMRGTVVEPLGVVRRGLPRRRRLWWRLALFALGALILLLNAGDRRSGDPLWVYEVSAGASMMLLSVPILLPSLVEKTVARLRGGTPSWQLAVRRLQQDSGTPSRVVGGIAAVLAGGIALQILVADLGVGFTYTPPAEFANSVIFEVSPEAVGRVAADVPASPGVTGVIAVRKVDAEPVDDPTTAMTMTVADCATVRALLGVASCTDGEVFRAARSADGFTADRSMTLPGDTGRAWTVPHTVTEVPVADSVARLYGGFFATPGALKGIALDTSFTVRALYDSADPDAADRVRNLVAPLGHRVVDVSSLLAAGDVTGGRAMFTSIKAGVFTGVVVVLLLAGTSLLVMALESIRERRRPLAVLSASGVSTGVLARSLLWLVALPVAAGVVLAVVTGPVLASLMLLLSGESPVPTVDWAQLGTMVAAAVVVAVLMVVATFPFLRGATRLESLRTG